MTDDDTEAPRPIVVGAWRGIVHALVVAVAGALVDVLSDTPENWTARAIAVALIVAVLRTIEGGHDDPAVPVP